MRRRRFLEQLAVGPIALWAGSGRTEAQVPGSKAKAKARAKPKAAGTDPAPLPVDDQLGRVLELVRTGGRRLPGMIGAIVKGGDLTSIAAVGLRKIGSTESIRPDDRVHLGSCTKAMTATLIGALIDEGKLRWDLTIGEAFPDRAGAIHPEFRSVTLRQLLAHRAGLPRDATRWNLGPGLSPTEQRRLILSEMLGNPPKARPGSAYDYSNLGYMLAGLMAEEAARSPWEDLIRRRVFEPLGMASAGFGVPGTAGRVDQPWGHRESGGELSAVRLDNSPAMGPAGTVHCSMSDWARFATLHLQGESNGVKLLKPATLKALHTPTDGGEYAGGWMVLERSWAGGRALTHSGSNTTWFCTVWLAPARELALLVATNAGSKSAEAACDEAIVSMLRYVDLADRGRRR